MGYERFAVRRIGSGLAADRPPPDLNNAGDLYIATDESAALYQSTGTAWVSLNAPGAESAAAAYTDTQIQDAIDALVSVYQPLDSDLTAIAALTTTSYGRALLALADAAALRTAGGLVIGTNVQAFDTELAALAGLTSAADKVPYFTGSGTAALADFTSTARSLVDDTSTSAMRTTLGLAIGTDVQAQDAELAAIAGLTSAANKLPYFTGSGTAALADFTSAGRALVDDADAAAQRTTLGLGTIATQDASNVTISGGAVTGITDLLVADGGTGSSTASGARTNLGLVIGTNVQAWDADLDALAGLASAADKLPYFTAASTAAVTAFTAFGRSLVDDADAATAIATLGAAVDTVGSGTDITTNNVTSTKHGLAPKSPGDATKFLNGATTPAYALPPGYEFGYDQSTTNTSVTSTTESSGTTLIACAAHTFDGAAVMAEFFAPDVGGAASAATYCIVSLFESTTQIGRLCIYESQAASTGLVPMFGMLRFTPTAAAHTYTVTAFRITANVSVDAGAGGTATSVPMFIRFTKV